MLLFSPICIANAHRLGTSHSTAGCDDMGGWHLLLLVTQDFDALVGRHAAGNKLVAQKQLEERSSCNSLPDSLEELTALPQQQLHTSLARAFKEVLLSGAAVSNGTDTNNLLLESRK